MRMTSDDIVPSGGLHTIAKIRQATAGHDDVSLDEAAVRTFAAMDARLAELVAEIEATGAPTPLPTPPGTGGVPKLRADLLGELRY
jgi:hypothetical protein